MKYINILLLILSLLVNNCYSILKLYDSFNNELVSFYNVDLPKVNNNASYVEVIGNLFIATFNKNDDDPCKISGMPDNVDVLVIPFLQALKLGCKSYANILTSNSWVMIMSSQNLTNLKNVNEHNLNMYKSVTNNPKLIPRTLIIESLKGTLSPSSTNSKFHNPKEFNLETNIQTNVKEQVSNFSKGFTRILKEFGAKIKNHIQKVSKRIEDKVKEFINQKRELKSFAPKVIIFSSSHNGTPGIREQYNGDFNILGTAIPHLTLLSIEDTEKLIKIANKVIYVEITSEQGPWISLLKSESWKVFSIIMGVLYILIVMITMFLIPRTYMNLGCSLFNPIFWVYPGLSIISAFSFIILEIDPCDIDQNILSIFTRKLLCDLRDFLIVILYTILNMSWRIVSEKFCKEKRHFPFLFNEIHNFFKIIQPLSALTFVICFILRIVYDKSNLILTNLLKIAYIMDSVALGLIGLGLFLFGTLIILTLREIRRRQRITRCSKKLSKTVLMTLLMVISVVLYIGSKTFTTMLALTVENFKIEQISYNVMTVTYCLTMIFILEDKFIGHYLPSNREDNLNLSNTIALTSITSVGPPQPQPPSPPPPPPPPQNNSQINTNV